jgi:hypothetical protein
MYEHGFCIIFLARSCVASTLLYSEVCFALFCIRWYYEVEAKYIVSQKTSIDKTLYIFEYLSAM